MSSSSRSECSSGLAIISPPRRKEKEEREAAVVASLDQGTSRTTLVLLANLERSDRTEEGRDMPTIASDFKASLILNSNPTSSPRGENSHFHFLFPRYLSRNSRVPSGRR